MVEAKTMAARLLVQSWLLPWERWRPVMPDTRTVDRKAETRAQATISQIIFGLDDRNLARTLRLLEAESDSSDPSNNPGGSRCATCVTRGE
jgi:hypothetical protein